MGGGDTGSRDCSMSLVLAKRVMSRGTHQSLSSSEILDGTMKEFNLF